MYNSKTDKWIFGNRYAAVEHTGQSHDEVLSFMVLEYKKNALNIVQTGNAKSIEDFAGKIQKKTALSLVINNDKVLTKIIPGISPAEQLVSEAFPAIKLSDFYYEVVQSDALSVVSVCRKTDVDTIINEYKKYKWQVISFSLGQSTIFELENYINNEKVLTTNASVFFGNNGIYQLEKNTGKDTETYLINDLEITNEQLLSLGSVLRVINGDTTHNNFNSLLLEFTRLYRQQRVFTRGVQSGLGILFVLLLINMLLLSKYQTQLNEKIQENNTNIQAKKELRKLERQISIQKKLLQEMSQPSQTHTTYILDDIAGFIPQSISLSSLHYQPVIKKIKPGKEIITDKNTMIIEGISTSGDEFTNWINKLEQKTWTESVVISEYGAKKHTTNFKIQIHIKNDWKSKK